RACAPLRPYTTLFRSLRGTQALQLLAHLEDLDGLFHADRAYPRAAVRHPVDQALAGELEQRRAHGGAAGPVRRRQVGLDEPLMRRELATDDGLADRLRESGGAGGRRTVGFVSHLCAHALPHRFLSPSPLSGLVETLQRNNFVDNHARWADDDAAAPPRSISHRARTPSPSSSQLRPSSGSRRCHARRTTRAR